MYLYFNDAVLPGSFKPWFWLATVLLVGHGVEGLIAAWKASSRDRHPLTYGMYTFFVGFVGLQELFDR